MVMSGAEFEGQQKERYVTPGVRRLEQIELGIKRSYIGGQIAPILSSVVRILQGEGQAVYHEFEHGGRLAVSDISSEDERAYQVQFDPNKSNGLAFSAFFNSPDRLLSNPDCTVRFGDPDAEGSHAFNTSGRSLLDHNLRDIRQDLSIVRTVVQGAITERSHQ